ncbi:MAG: CCA tRNA nucleotidyltransferase [Desulfobacteraceae bacterium]|jgi:tRNA nucleotidyltransferase/poly(A) polymerase|nr:MAG: CCA tRNA nucleotidyltransferase [Desulfobacteraceae bacterium]
MPINFDGRPILLPAPVEDICRRLKNAGHEAYVVGGGVRNSLLGLPVIDWDIVTSASLEETASLFKEVSHFTLKNKTTTLVVERNFYQITPFRGKIPSLETDLSLRDFTINAIAYDPDKGKLIDPQKGQRDLEKSLLKCVGNPLSRFREDPLRILRAVRIACQLNFTIDPQTLTAISAHGELLEKAAGERIRDEILKIILSKKPSSGMRLLFRTGLMHRLIPELAEGYRKRQSPPHQHTILEHAFMTLDLVPDIPHLRLAAILHDVAKPFTRTKTGGSWHFYGHEKAGVEMVSSIMNRLRFDTKTKRAVNRLVEHHMLIYDSRWSNAAVRRFVNRVGEENVRDLIILRKADILAQGSGDDDVSELDELAQRIHDLTSERSRQRWSPLAVDGHSVMDTLGIKPGRTVGIILNKLQEIVLDDPSVNSRENLFRILMEWKSKNALEQG